jgi:MFS family permease
LYPISVARVRHEPPGTAARSASVVPRNVLFLGVTSLLTDVSSEMVTSVIPLYLMLHLQLSPAAFGVIDGLQQGAASLVRLLGGVLTDRSRRFKRIAGVGYAMSALSRLGLLVSGTTAFSFGAVTLFDRLGKGLRTAPRDALISLSVAPPELGRAFALHRTLDTAGALLGPLVAFGLLSLAPSAYDAVFVVSFVVALLGVGVLATFVRDPGTASSDGRPTFTLSDARRTLSQRGFGVLVLSAAALGLMTLSDSFLYLVLQRRLRFDSSYVPLLYVATPAVYMLLALPLGRLADRVGRARVVALGYVLLLLCYGTLLVPLPGMLAVPLMVGLLGGYYAATDGVLMALASGQLPEGSRASGIALVTTTNNLGRLMASIAFGFLWSRFDPQTALLAFGLSALGIFGLVALILPRLREVWHA